MKSKNELTSSVWKSKAAFVLVSAFALTAIATGCGAKSTQSAPTETKQAAKPSEAPKMPEVLRIGFLPGEEVEGKIKPNSHRRLVQDMAESVGLKTEMFIGDDYTAVVEAMRAKKIDVAEFGPFSYLIAAERSGAVPFAMQAKSKEEAFYHSLIVVPANSKAEKLEDLKGKTFLFADPASTSGHLFPRAMFINKLGIKNENIESFFSNVSFSGGHDKSILAIAKGNADGAGVCDTCIQSVIKSGLVKESDFRVLATSDPIPPTLYAYRKDLPPELVEKIKNFYYEYHKQNPEYFSNEKRYLPVEDKDYQIVKDTAKALNMSPEQLLKK